MQPEALSHHERGDQVQRAWWVRAAPHSETQPIVELKAPPSSNRFWPTMKPAEALHRKAQASPNSAGSPTRPVGFDWPRLASISSNEMFYRRASYSMPERSRSVRNGPGNSPLIVTLYLATWRARPAQNAVRPARAPLPRPK